MYIQYFMHVRKCNIILFQPKENKQKKTHTWQKNKDTISYCIKLNPLGIYTAYYKVSMLIH